MTAEEFSAFCEARSKRFGNKDTEIAIIIVRFFLLNEHPHLPTKEEILCFLDVHITACIACNTLPSFVEGYRWLKAVLLTGSPASSEDAPRDRIE